MSTQEKSWLGLLFSFRGRASRPYFWLVGVLGIYMLVATVHLIDWKFDIPDSNTPAFFLVLPGLWCFFVTAVKRLHDRNRSGWALLIGMIPFLGAIWLIREIGFLPGWPGPNKYGPPCGVEQDTPAADGP